MAIQDQIETGDCTAILNRWADEGVQVHACVTSPPYFGLRDYGHEGQIGLEKTPDEYVANLVEVFRAVRRVLRDDGTLWLNLGDSYAGGGGGNYSKSAKQTGHGEHVTNVRNRSAWLDSSGLKPKDLIGIPWRVAFALQADGWYLRQDIIWQKPNPMPESVRDRCTKTHEYVFLLSKSPQYYYDHEAIKEPAVSCHLPGNRTHRGQTTYERGDEHQRTKSGLVGYANKLRARKGAPNAHPETRNRRSVWSVATKPFGGAHFATFPPDLIRPCILAGCPEGGVVLDPFMGSGTTAAVAIEARRHYLGCEINPDYQALQDERIRLATRQAAQMDLFAPEDYRVDRSA